MSSDLKKEYTFVTYLRYREANKKKKTQILNEFCENLKLTRKHAIRQLQRDPRTQPKRPGRKKVYSEQAIFHLRKLWFLTEQLNSKLLKRGLPDWLENYVTSTEVKVQLLMMSASTIERCIAPIRAKVARRLRTGTRPPLRFYKQVIPIKPFDLTVTGPGHVEADTVAHCGGSLLGEFIWSLTLTDIHTGWTENRAVWGKGGKNVLDAIIDIEKGLPFEILSFNSDNGGEFLNHHLIRHFGPNGKKPRPSQLMTRSRAYRKNDNCYVEQKNWTHVRTLFGYDRFSNPDQVELMNSIYKEEHNLLRNFFYPQMKLKSKVRIGSKYKRTYDIPQTPYQRVMNCDSIPQETKDRLTQIKKSLNPFILRKEMQKKLKSFYQANYPITEKKEAA